MQWQSGSRLVERFGPQEPGRTVHLLAQSCDVLHEAHTHNMIHRDIKPANIFVTYQPDEGDFVEVVDFGLVRAIGCDRGEPTTPQNMSGTMAFLPPEVVTAECVGECDVDGRADAGLLSMRAQHRPPIPFGTWANLGTSGGRGDLQWSENM